MRNTFETATHKPEIRTLTSIRGIAALWVVCYHLYANIWAPLFGFRPYPFGKNLLNGGLFCVDIFFVLSGYILAYTYKDQFNIKNFAWHRFARIFPLHLGILAVLIISYTYSHADFILATSAGHQILVTSLFYFSLTFVWFGLPVLWNPPTWSLSAELAAYFLFPLCRGFTFKLTSHTAIAVAALFVLAQGLFIFKLGFPSTGGYALARAFLGMAAGVSIQAIKTPENPPAWLAATAAIGLVVCLSAGLPGLATAPTAMLIFALGKPAKNIWHDIFGSAASVYAGRVSYSIYLSHAPLLGYAQIKLHHGSELFGKTMSQFNIIYFTLLLTLSAATYHLVERPSRRYLRRLYNVQDCTRQAG